MAHSRNRVFDIVEERIQAYFSVVDHVYMHYSYTNVLSLLTGESRKHDETDAHRRNDEYRNGKERKVMKMELNSVWGSLLA